MSPRSLLRNVGDRTLAIAAWLDEVFLAEMQSPSSFLETWFKKIDNQHDLSWNFENSQKGSSLEESGIFHLD
ncbi:hypothetical protein [Rubidibacter lacunae]|uniref:hypothetical protein n=1 Tax=Rubidibacter lacunae TaxID=582514 RepID=UPI0018DD0692|nr:hypothetical protein [Rubidibacter lacunae]